MRVVLHIGTEKTGTTTLQDFVYAQREVLRRHGVALSDLLGTTNNRKLASYCMPPRSLDDYFKDRRIRTEAERAAHFAGFREGFVAEAQACAGWAHTLFITSEHFHSRLRDGASVRRLKALLDEVADEVLVVCWFREQSAVLRSLYSTAVKGGNAAGLEHYARRCRPDNDYYNYHTLLARWSAVFGRDALRPRLFDRARFVGGDIRRDLLALLLPGAALEDFDFSAPPSNQGLGAAGLELGRTLNRLCPRYLEDGTLNPLRQTLMQQLMHSELARLGEHPVPGARAIHAAFDASNVRFAAEFLGEAGNPFPPPVEREAETTLAVPLDVLRRFYEELLPLVGDPAAPGRIQAPPTPAAPAGRLAGLVRRGWDRLTGRDEPAEDA